MIRRRSVAEWDDACTHIRIYCNNNNNSSVALSCKIMWGRGGQCDIGRCGGSWCATRSRTVAGLGW